ncbi:MAG TPA: creatininase family protein [Longimicrobiales bacterium]|nr:creatininase family protein [Longimicrobiales bacterium]
MSGVVRELSTLTWPEVDALERARTIAVLPVGAIEAHGPHLPLGTDVIIARAMAAAGARRLDARGYTSLLLPPIVYSPAPFAAGFAGTISLRPSVMRDQIVDIAAALAGHGFRCLAIVNAHFDPAQVSVLRATVEEIRAAGAPLVAFPDLTRRETAARLTDEFRSGACHAGQYETSIVLAEQPELVREEERRALEPYLRSLSEAIRDGVRSFGEAGGEQAYFGAPAAATADEGRRTIDTLGVLLEEEVVAVLERDREIGWPGRDR